MKFHRYLEIEAGFRATIDQQGAKITELASKLQALEISYGEKQNIVTNLRRQIQGSEQEIQICKEKAALNKQEAARRLQEAIEDKQREREVLRTQLDGV